MIYKIYISDIYIYIYIYINKLCNDSSGIKSYNIQIIILVSINNNILARTNIQKYGLIGEGFGVFKNV